jgi:hypothetical protein
MPSTWYCRTIFAPNIAGPIDLTGHCFSALRM